MNPPTDNPAVMPLEEAVTGLREMLRYDLAKKWPFRLNEDDVKSITAALHHLEAGKQAQDERMDLAMAYAEGFKDGFHCYSEDPSPERYLDGNWNDSNTKKIWSATLSSQPKGEA